MVCWTGRLRSRDGASAFTAGQIRLWRRAVSACVLVFLLSFPSLWAQDCHDPINGCSPADQEGDDDANSAGGGSYSCLVCPEVAAAYQEVLALYYGSETPGPAVTLPADVMLVDSDARLLQRLLASLGSGEYLATARKLTDSAADGYAQVDASALARADLVARTELTTHSSVDGDPNILASGTLTLAEPDLLITVGEVACAVERTYRSDRAQWSSFGPGWSGTGDARILLGTTPNLAPVCADLHAAKLKLDSLMEESDVDVGSAIAQLRDHHDRRVAPNCAAAMEAEAKARAVYERATAASGRGAVELVAECAELRSLTRDTADRYRRLTASLSDGLTALAELAPGGAVRDAVAELAGTFSLLEKKAQHEYRRTLANETKNRKALHAEDPLEYWQCGVDSVTLLDGQGVPHLYHYDAAAIPEEEVGRYTDGSPCYFPVGASLTPVDSHDPPLSLGVDGTWTLRRRDGIGSSYDYFGLIETTSDRNGNAVRFERSAEGTLTALLDNRGRRISIETNHGRIVSAIDPLGRIIRYTYDSEGRLVSVVDATRCAIRYSYEGALLVAIEKPDGSRIVYDYAMHEGHRVLVATTDEEGYRERFTYGDGWTVYTNRSGASTTYRFDGQQRELAVEYPDGTRRTTEYDQSGWVIRTTDEVGAVTRYERDPAGNPVRTFFADGSTSSTRYDASGRVIERTGVRGGRTAFSYDDRGNLLSVVHPDGARVAFSYDAFGNRLSMTDERGNITRYTYDRYGRMTTRRAADGGIVRYRHDAVGNLLDVTDELGHRTRFEYTPDNRLAAVVDPLGRSEHYRYDSRKDLVEHVDRLGSSTHYEYDRRHLCVRLTDAVGISRRFEYRADGRIKEFAVDDRDPIRYDYDARGRLVSFGRSGRHRRFERDAAGRIVAVTDPVGNTVRLRRDAIGRIVALVDPFGASRLFRYDASSNLVAVTDRVGAVTEFIFDSRNRLLSQCDALGSLHRYTYDPSGNLTSFTDGRGATTSFSYDARNRLAGVTDAAGAARRYTFSADGSLATVTDRRGSTWSYTYDPVGRLVTVTDPLGGRRSFTYNPEGRPTSLTDPNGNNRRFEYDRAGRLTARIDPYGAATRYSYLSLDSVESVTGMHGGTWHLAYDGAGRLVSTQDPEGGTRTYGYDGNGNLVASSDPGGATTRFEYDSLNRLRRRVDPTGAVLVWDYDAEGRVLTETDPNGHSYRFSYDAVGRLVGETDRSGRHRRYTYDKAGNPVSERDFNGNVLDYRYDLLGRLVAIDGRDGISAYSYDPEGNLVAAKNGARSYRFSYDALSRMVTAIEDRYQGRRNYRYDANGNCTEVRDRGAGTINWMRYGSNGELLALTDAERAQTLFEYDPGGNLVQVVRPNGVVEQRSYDLVGRPTSTVVAAAGRQSIGPPLWGQVYLYDASGRRNLLFDSNEGPTAYRYDPAGRLIEVSVPPDSLVSTEIARAAARLAGPVRLAAAGIASDPSAPSTESSQRVASEYLEISPSQASALRALLRTAMPLSRALFRPRCPVVRVAVAYDPAGNRIEQTGPGGTIEYRYGVDHELLGAGLRRYSYDRNGNLLRETFGDERIDYHYSASNRLTRVSFVKPQLVRTGDEALASVAPASIDYAYDALGRRTLRRTRWVPLAAGAPAPTSREARSESCERATTTEETFDYEGLTLRLARTTLRTTETSEIAKDPLSSARGGRYRYLGPGDLSSRDGPAETVSRLYAAGRLLETTSAGSTLYHSTDPLGSVVASTDRSGTLVRVTAYSPFGVSSQASPGDRLQPGFAGKDLDPLTGFYDFGMRDYSPLMGRWTTPDPIKSGANWYLYAGNDPVNFVDPAGLLIEPVSLTYYQDVNPRTGMVEPYADDVLGSLPVVPDADTSKLTETIGRYGCLLTAACRIANSMNRDESITPGEANITAAQNGLFSLSRTGQKDELTQESTAALLAQLTSAVIAQERLFGTGSQLESELRRLNQDDLEHYVIGHLIVGDGQSAYSHYVNVQAITNDGRIAVADTSITNREYLNRKNERMVDVMVFTLKVK